MKLVWFDDPRQLVDDKQFLQFWPNSNQSPEDRINAASRFIIYASSLLYLIRRDARIFILGATLLGVIYVLYKAKTVRETFIPTPTPPDHPSQPPCRSPPRINRRGTFLWSDSAWHQTGTRLATIPASDLTCSVIPRTASRTTADDRGPPCLNTFEMPWNVSS